MLKIQSVSRMEYAAMLKEEDARYFLNQDPRFGEMKESEGQKVLYLLFQEDERTVGFALVAYYSYKRVLLTARCTYGPVLLEDISPSSYETFMTLLRKEVFYSPRVRMFRLQPFLPDNRYEDVTTVEENVSAEYAAVLERIGYQRVMEDPYVNTSYPPNFVYTKNIEGLDEAEVLEAITPALRYRMRKAERDGIRVHMLTGSDIEEYIRLEQELAGTRAYTGIPDAAFYHDLQKFMGKDVYFPAAYIDCEKTLQCFGEQLAELDAERAELDARYADKPQAKKYKNSVRALEEIRQRIEKNIGRVQNLSEEKGNIINVYYGCFVRIGRDMICLTLAGRKEYGFLDGGSAIHEHMLGESARRKVTYYNLYGCSGRTDKEAMDFGVLKYKRSFDGRFEDVLGSYEIK
ncbi:MAG: peptidoglycan bridge formation glycyltransferase FemA/FemB family protein [Eubacteriales bacterium]|nr:peptidoglycan bridge formation glycyltransferase FemA/FemB family protein [Eubacteriales bacterium]